MLLRDIRKSLFSAQPDKVLYHYTSLDTALSILNRKELWASEIHYMSDAYELSNAARLITSAANARGVMDGGNAEVLEQFSRWVKDRFSNMGHSLYVCCFSEKGNLLSQWRGYCPDGKGISVGLNPLQLADFSAQQGFALGRCIYDSTQQTELVKEIVVRVESYALSRGPASDRHPKNSFYPAFEDIESDLLQIASLLKYKAFYEEDEWRLVSDVHTRPGAEDIGFRPGPSMLIPYKVLHLPVGQSGKLLLSEAFVGPTPNQSLSMMSFSAFLHARVEGVVPVSYSQIPYRPW